MFKEVKKIVENSNQIKNRIELQHIANEIKIDRTETCFAGKSHLTEEQYQENNKLTQKSASSWF